jgi:hypothetical protein
MRLGFGLACACMTLAAVAQERQPLTLSITHPGFESKKAEEHALEMQPDAKGNPAAYFMEVRSVFCSDEKCDVIKLTMQWDALGRFVGYQLPKAATLTKYDHEPFEKDDYAKFDELMKHRSSLLAGLEPRDIIVKKKNPDQNTKPGTKPKPKDVAGKGDALQKVDALSGATPSYLQDELVEGAAYTCYTMWHWANGNTAAQIRAHSQKHGSPEWLHDLLGSKDVNEVDFALEAIAGRDLRDKAMQSKVISAAKDSSTEGYRIVLDYLADSNPEVEQRYAAYLELMRNATGPHRAQLLEQLLRQADPPPIAGLEPMAAQLMDFERFYELQLFLNLANKHPAPSDQLLTEIGKVLDHENFFFSRRAHAFLKGRNLPATLQTRLAHYETEHAGRL